MVVSEMHNIIQTKCFKLFWLLPGLPWALRSFSSSRTGFWENGSVLEPFECLKGPKVGQTTVCWCILPLSNVWGSF